MRDTDLTVSKLVEGSHLCVIVPVGQHTTPAGFDRGWRTTAEIWIQVSNLSGDGHFCSMDHQYIIHR